MSPIAEGPVTASDAAEGAHIATKGENSAPALNEISLESGEQFECAEGEKVLTAMVRAGIKNIPVGCRNGGCGACRIEVMQGNYECLRMGKNHVDDIEAEQGFALACRIMPRSDLRVRIAKKLSIRAGKVP